MQINKPTGATFTSFKNCEDYHNYYNNIVTFEVRSADMFSRDPGIIFNLCLLEDSE